jgi:xylulose-5-phosphate/fructose-6-phosphate phosphoketolase
LRLTPHGLAGTDAYGRAAATLRRPDLPARQTAVAGAVAPEYTKPRLLAHWDTAPRLNFVYVHLNRLVGDHDLDVIQICGPGQGWRGTVANTWLEGTSERTTTTPSTWW